MQTCLPESENPMYMLMEISEEVGEINGKFAKAIRKGQINIVDNQVVAKCSSEEYVQWLESVLLELGDVMWGIAGLADVLGFSMETVAQMNVEKLASRMRRNKIQGNGDYR